MTLAVISGVNMLAPSESGSTADPASGVQQDWLVGNSVWHGPRLEISGIKSSGSITVMTYHRADGESIWLGARHRIGLTLDQLPSALVQVEQGPNRQGPVASGTLAFFPAGLKVRVVHPAASLVQVLWDTDVYSALLPELGAAPSVFDFLYPFQDPLLAQIITTLAHEIEGGFVERILIESLGTALYIRLAQHFVGHLVLPSSGGLQAERLERVRDYVEAHLDDHLSLTVLADIACLSLYHFSRSFKQATGVGLQRYVMQRRLARARALMRRTNQPLAWVAQEAGFADQSHLTSVFRREMGVTPGRFRAELT